MWPTLIDDAVIPTSVLPFGAAPPPPGTGAPDAGAEEPPDGAADPELWPPPAAGPLPGVGDAADRAAPDDDFPAELAAGDAAPDPEAPPAAPGWAAAGAEGPASVGWATPACSGAANDADAADDSHEQRPGGKSGRSAAGLRFCRHECAGKITQ